MLSVVDEIKNQVDIVDVVQEYVDLSKKGKNYWGVCPFHNDSNPSMSVSPERQMFNCFSCGASGGVFKFVQDIEKITFKEALSILGKKVGIEVQVNNNVKRYDETQEKMISAFKDANDFYMISIDSQDGTSALEYAEGRGLNHEIRERFSIGYAPNGGLVKFLTRKGHDESILINTSLMNQTGNDFFRNRLTFAIKNSFGDVVAFSGRTLENESAKYINSSESKVFKKNAILYNWDVAKDYSKKEVFIVEGFMDVIALYKAGIKNAVAIMGTALTKSNINKFSNLEVNLMLDSDIAGKNATIKSIKILLESNIKTNVIPIVEGKDIDEIFSSSGSDGVQNLIDKKKTALEYIYEMHKEKYSITSSNDIQLFIESFRKYLIHGTEIEKDYFGNLILNELGISKDISLKGIVKQSFGFERKFTPKPSPSPKQLQKIELDFNKNSFKLIRTLLHNKGLCQYYETIKNKPHFIDEMLITLSTYIIKAQNGEMKIPASYMGFVQEKVGLDGERVDTKEGVDWLIKSINADSAQYKRNKNKVKLLNKGGK